MHAANTTYHSSGNCIIKTATNGLELGGCRSVIPNYVTIISSNAFRGRLGLTSINIPNLVTSIGGYAFADTGLTRVVIPDSVTTLGSGAFAFCNSLANVTMSKNIQDISDWAFGNNYIVATYNFSAYESIPTVQSATFTGIKTGSQIIVPAALYADWIARADWQPYVDYIVSADNYFGLYDSNGVIIYTWEELVSLGKITVTNGELSGNDSTLTGTLKIPNTITSIANNAFKNYTKLVGELEIPNSITSIGTEAFYGCTGLTSLTIPESVTSIGGSAFHNCKGLQTLNYNANISATYNSNTEPFYYAGQNSTTSKCQLVIGNNVTSIPTYMFYYSRITSVVVGSGVTNISNNAFYGCEKLQEVYNLSSLNLVVGNSNHGYVAYYASVIYNQLGESEFVTDADGYVIYNDGVDVILVEYTGSNTELVLPSNITRIAQRAFYGKSNITSVVIPDSVISIGENAFSSCSKLTSVTIGNGVSLIEDYAFAYCYALAEIVFPNSVTKLESYIFSECRELTSINIPASVTAIGSNPFVSCSNITSITVDSANTKYHSENNCLIETSTNRLISGCQNSVIPNYITKIGSCAFMNCTNLTNIIIPNSVTRIEVQAFYSCDGLTHVILPDFVTFIGSYVFYGCDNIVYIVIGSGVTSIDNYTFNSLNKLQYIYYNGTAEQWGRIGIGNNNPYLSADRLYYYTEDCAHEVDGQYWKYNSSGEIEQVGPSVDAWVTTVQPTCQQPGQEQGYCTSCGQTIVRELPVIAHNMVDGACIICGATEPKYTITNDTKYPWTEDADGVLSSGNAGVHSTTSTYTITANDYMRITIEYMVSSETNYDKLTIKHGDTILVNAISGTTSYVELTINLASGDVLIFAYSKDSSANSGSDKAFVKITYIGLLSAATTASASISDANSSVSLANLQFGNKLQVAYVKTKEESYELEVIFNKQDDDDYTDLDVILNKNDDYDTDTPPQINQTTSV